MQFRECTRCGETKAISEFYKQKKGKFGVAPHCKVCNAILDKKYKERRKEYSRKVGYTPAHREAYVNSRLRDPRLSLFRGAKARAKKYGIVFELTLEDIIIPDICPILGLPLEPRINEPGVYKSNPNSPSLDRLNPTLGYVKENVFVISNLANIIKNSGSAEDHRRIAEWIEKQTL